MKKTAVCSETLPESAKRDLSRFVDRIVLLPPHPALPKPVASHADMLFCTVDKTVFFDKIYTDTYPDAVEAVRAAGGFDLNTVPPLGGKYPYDVSLNVLVADEFAVCKAALAPEKIITSLAGRRVVSVNQGYAACSCLCFRGLLITADRGIARALDGVCDTLLIKPGGVSLPPYGTGFIGGASGADEDKVLFVGDIDAHPDGAQIKAALTARGAVCVSLGKDGLYDVGGIKFLNN